MEQCRSLHRLAQINQQLAAAPLFAAAGDGGAPPAAIGDGNASKLTIGVCHGAYQVVPVLRKKLPHINQVLPLCSVYYG